jgi:hypothetical protein
MPEQRDFWWKVRDDSSLDSVKLDLLERIDRYGVPWLDRGHDIGHSIQLTKEYGLIDFIAALEQVRAELGGAVIPPSDQ